MECPFCRTETEPPGMNMHIECLNEMNRRADSGLCVRCGVFGLDPSNGVSKCEACYILKTEHRGYPGGA